MCTKTREHLDPMLVGGLLLNTLSLVFRQVSAVPHFISLILSVAALVCYGIFLARRSKAQSGKK